MSRGLLFPDRVCLLCRSDTCSKCILFCIRRVSFVFLVGLLHGFPNLYTDIQIFLASKSWRPKISGLLRTWSHMSGCLSLYVYVRSSLSVSVCASVCHVCVVFGRERCWSGDSKPSWSHVSNDRLLQRSHRYCALFTGERSWRQTKELERYQ